MRCNPLQVGPDRRDQLPEAGAEIVAAAQEDPVQPLQDLRRFGSALAGRVRIAPDDRNQALVVLDRVRDLVAADPGVEGIRAHYEHEGVRAFDRRMNLPQPVVGRRNPFPVDPRLE